MGRVNVGLWWTDLRAADLEHADSLPQRERARVDEVSDQTQRGRRLAGQLLLQHAIRQVRGLPDCECVEIDRTCSDCGEQHGRPVPADGRGPHVSVSHSGLAVCVATCSDAPVGVDVERVEGAASARTAELGDWVVREARTKAGLASDGGPATVVRISCPLAGYVAALAVAADAEVHVTEHFLHG